MGDRQGAHKEFWSTAKAVEKKSSEVFAEAFGFSIISIHARLLKFFAPKLHSSSFLLLFSKNREGCPKAESGMSSFDLMFDRWLYTLSDEDRAYFLGDPEAIPLFMAGWKQHQADAKKKGDTKRTEEEILDEYLKEWVAWRPSKNIDLGEFEDPRYSGHLASMPGIRILDVEPIARIEPEDDGKGKRKTSERVQPPRRGKRDDGSSSGR